MFQDNGDSMGKLRAQIGLAKCLVFKKDQREASHFYQLAVATCHQTENKVSLQKNILLKKLKSYAIKIYEDLIIIETHNNLVSNIERYTSLLRQALKDMRIKCGACLGRIEHFFNQFIFHRIHRWRGNATRSAKLHTFFPQRLRPRRHFGLPMLPAECLWSATN